MHASGAIPISRQRSARPPGSQALWMQPASLRLGVPGQADCSRLDVQLVNCLDLQLVAVVHIWSLTCH